MAYNSTFGLVQLLGTNSNAKFPINLIRYETYKVTPNQNQDLDSTVDTTGNLHRYPLDHTRTKIEFNMPITTGDVVTQVMDLLSSYWNKPTERKVHLRYFNPLTNGYQTGYFYIPDIDFTIMNIDEANGIIKYTETRIAFIEY